MRDSTRRALGPSRRVVTAGVMGAGALVLAGCGIRLEDDAPRVPLVPTRSPIDGETALVTLLGAVRDAAAAPVDPTAPLSPRLAPLHRRQATVLHDALRQRGVPAAELAPTPTSTPSGPSTAGPSASTTASGGASSSPAPTGASASPTPSPPSTLTAVESAVVAAGKGGEQAPPDLRPTVVALLGLSHAALELTTGNAAPSPDAEPSWTAPDGLVPLVESLHRSTYLLQVAAARGPAQARGDALDVIARIEDVTREVVVAAGSSAPAPELGYALPQPVGTPAQATALATQTFAGLLETFGASLGKLTETDPGPVFELLPRWLGTVAAQAQRTGIPLTPFPGLV